MVTRGPLQAPSGSPVESAKETKGSPRCRAKSGGFESLLLVLQQSCEPTP